MGKQTLVSVTFELYQHLFLQCAYSQILFFYTEVVGGGVKPTASLCYQDEEGGLS